MISNHWKSRSKRSTANSLFVIFNLQDLYATPNINIYLTGVSTTKMLPRDIGFIDKHLVKLW